MRALYQAAQVDAADPGGDDNGGCGINDQKEYQDCVPSTTGRGLSQLPIPSR